jgi:hypothetical protein
MSGEFEQQLRGVFGRLPKPSREASARARSGALATIGPRDRPWSRGLVLALVAVAFAIGAGAAALAATGNLRVAIGTRQQPARPVPTRLSVPRGSHGLALVAGGKLWLATRNGLRIEGMPVSTAELSPRALYAVVGIGSSLVTLAPGNRRPWVHQTDGGVVAASWSPDGLKIAYVVARRGGYELRLIEGDGSPDRLLVRRISAAKPSWRPDALAVAYVDARGRAAVYDLATSTTRTFDTRRCGGRAQAVAYAPRGQRLAVAAASGVALVERWDRAAGCVDFEHGIGINGLAWRSAAAVVTSEKRLRGIGSKGALRGYRAAAGTLDRTGAAFTRKVLRAVAVPAEGGPLAVAFEPAAGAVELAIVSRTGPASRVLHVQQPLVRLRARASAVSISWR